MIQIIGGTTDRDGDGGSIISHAADEASTGDWLEDQYIALDKKFDSRLHTVRFRLITAFEKDADGVSIKLSAELDRELWLRLLYRAFIGIYAGAELDFPGELKDLNDVRLSWELSKDGETLRVQLHADDEFIGDADWEWFFSESYWESIGLRWLIHQLGNTPADIKEALRAMPRK